MKLLAKKYCCHHCFHEFNKPHYRCKNPNCVMLPDEALGKFLREDPPPSRLPSFSMADGTFYDKICSLFGIDTLSCPHCGEKAKTPICPNCHNDLPDLHKQKEQFQIALTGDTYSGKSVYFTVLIQELSRREVVTPYNVNITSQGDHTRKRYREDFYRPLYEEKQLFQATRELDSQTKLPLTFKIGKNTIDTTIGSSVFMNFYDKAGEEFVKRNRMEMELHYIRHANGIILLIDPLQLDGFRKVLASRKVILPPRRNRHLDIINNIYEEIAKREKKNGKLDIPLAICLTKVDYFDTYAREFLDPNSLLIRNSNYSRDYERNDAELRSISTEVKALLNNPRLGDEANFMAYAESHFSNIIFLAVSALGSIPQDSGELQINPKRVTDPIIWMLRQFKFL